MSLKRQNYQKGRYSKKCILYAHNNVVNAKNDNLFHLVYECIYYSPLVEYFLPLNTPLFTFSLFFTTFPFQHQYTQQCSPLLPSYLASTVTQKIYLSSFTSKILYFLSNQKILLCCEPYKILPRYPL